VCGLSCGAHPELPRCTPSFRRASLIHRAGLPAQALAWGMLATGQCIELSWPSQARPARGARKSASLLRFTGPTAAVRAADPCQRLLLLLQAVLIDRFGYPRPEELLAWQASAKAQRSAAGDAAGEGASEAASGGAAAAASGGDAAGEPLRAPLPPWPSRPIAHPSVLTALDPTAAWNRRVSWITGVRATASATDSCSKADCAPTDTCMPSRTFRPCFLAHAVLVLSSRIPFSGRVEAEVGGFLGWECLGLPGVPWFAVLVGSQASQSVAMRSSRACACEQRWGRLCPRLCISAATQSSDWAAIRRQALNPQIP
jgi:hypothetical protein